MTQHTNLYAMKQALEALEGGSDSWRRIDPAITALRLAIEQAERQEPVADTLIRKYVAALVANVPDAAAEVTKAMVDYCYTAPPQRQPLTEEEIGLISAECALVTPSDIYFARAIERAHGVGGGE